MTYTDGVRKLRNSSLDQLSLSRARKVAANVSRLANDLLFDPLSYGNGYRTSSGVLNNLITTTLSYLIGQSFHLRYELISVSPSSAETNVYRKRVGDAESSICLPSHRRIRGSYVALHGSTPSHARLMYLL